MENKESLRLKIKTERKNLDILDISRRIVAKIRLLEIYKKAKNVMLYYPMKHEINILELMKDKKNFYFPRVDGKNLLVCPSDCEFKKSKYNIYEPSSNPINPERLDLIIVPALAADKKNYRLGYGGGFYDRFLKNFPNIKSVVPVYNKFLYEKLPTESYDMPVYAVITD